MALHRSRQHRTQQPPRHGWVLRQPAQPGRHVWVGAEPELQPDAYAQHRRKGRPVVPPAAARWFPADRTAGATCGRGDAAGVVADAGGAPKPIYWASDEDYYVEVKDCDGNTIQTVDNYNAPASTPTPGPTDIDLSNYLLNPQFRFFIKQEFDSNDPIEGNELPSGTETLVANEGWYFDRNNNNSTMTVSFVDFNRGQTDVPNFPIRYLRQQTTSFGAAGETEKDICFPIKGVGTFANSEIVISFWAKAQTTGDAGTITLRVKQDFGSGGSPTAEREQIIDTIPLTTSWAQYTRTVTAANINGN